MSKVSIGLFSAMASIVVLASAGISLGDVPLQQPVVEVREGDELADISWSDPGPEDLVVIHQPVLGSIQFPWKGNATLVTQGFYSGGCDWAYDIQVFAILDAIVFSWNQVTDWKTKETISRAVRVTETDLFYELSDGIEVKILSEGLFLPDLNGWNGPTPVFHGVYAGTAVDPRDTLDFSFACTSGGELGGGGGTITFDWADENGGSGSIVVGEAGEAVPVDLHFKITFPSGTYVTGETFSVGLIPPFATGEDRFTVRVETFDGYLVLRHSVEDRPSAEGDSIGQFKVIANISKCDTFELFSLPNGDPDPYGMRYYTDRGITASQPGVTPDPDVKTVLNGFPYDYAVVTYDWTDDHTQVFSEITWKRVFPAAAPASTADNVYVIPNPYVGRAGWETGGQAKIQFVNVPAGAEIRIYDVTGGYINTVRPNVYSYDSTKPQGSADWNLKDDDGEDVVSGIYIYRIESRGSTETGRFIVVR